MNREMYGFVRFSKVRDVGKLLKAVNVVYFGNYRVRATIARFDRSVVVEGNSVKEDAVVVKTIDRGGVEGKKQAGEGGNTMVNGVRGVGKK